MANFNLKRGYSLKIQGAAERVLKTLEVPKKVALQPLEFPGVKAKLNVQPGDKVKIGSVLFTDKQNPDLKIVSPVSGEVIEINRGERRALQEIVIQNDLKDDKESLIPRNLQDIASLSREQIISDLLNGGMWPFIIQRPFSKIANPQIDPRDIFISGMDTSPLAADPNFLLQGMEEDFQIGLNILKQLTSGSVYLSMNARESEVADAFKKAQGVEKNYFQGPHPAGNVGVQIHHLKPIKKGDVVWTVKPYDVALIGKFFAQGFHASERIIAVAGSALQNRLYYKTIVGAPVNMLIPENNIIDDEVRFISGNVLTGRKIPALSYVSFYDQLITVIPEIKKERKLFSYIRPGLNVPSYSKTYLSNWLRPRKKDYVYDTALHGGARAFVASGDYESVLPMDIFPVYLAKSIMTEDIEEMEGLGILELDEEDVALCSYICLSKTNFGQLIRQGLNLIEREG